MGLFLGGVSASGKLFLDFPGKAEMFEKMGYSVGTMFWIGIVEVAAAVLFLIPQTSFLGAILLTGYLGGATEVHVRMKEPFVFPIIFGVLVWIGYWLRRPDVIQSAFRRG